MTFSTCSAVPRRKVANFEKKVKKIDGRDGYIDLLWKNVLLVEYNSRGHDLDRARARARAQARDYFHGLTDAELPRYLLVSDFARFRLYDLEGDGEPVEFALKDLHKHVRVFGFIAGYQARSFKDEDLVNIEAAERMGRLRRRRKSRRPQTAQTLQRRRTRRFPVRALSGVDVIAPGRKAQACSAPQINSGMTPNVSILASIRLCSRGRDRGYGDAGFRFVWCRFAMLGCTRVGVCVCRLPIAHQ